MENTMNTVKVHLIEEYLNTHPEEVIRHLEESGEEEALEIIRVLKPQYYHEIFARLNVLSSINILEKMDESLAATILDYMDPARAAMMLASFSADEFDRVTLNLSKNKVRMIEDLMTYEPGTAGSIMDPKVMGFHGYTTTDKTLEHIRAEKITNLYNVYTIDEFGVLNGYVTLQELALAPPGTKLEQIAHKNVISVKAVELAEEVVIMGEEKKLSSIPVVDFEGKLLGVIRYNTLVNAVHQDAMEDIQSMVGASPSERALSPVSFAVKKRLPWLQINLLTSFLAAAVVGIFEGTINQVTALAVLLPIVAGQSGNTGAQALAVTLRGLSLREIRVQHWLPVLRKELLTGFVNGLAVAVVAMLGVWLWSSSLGISGVIGLSMTISMAIAGGSGALVPIVLKAFKQDPAQSSSIVITTVTDVVGFFSFLGLATLFIEYLPVG